MHSFLHPLRDALILRTSQSVMQVRALGSYASEQVETWQRGMQNIPRRSRERGCLATLSIERLAVTDERYKSCIGSGRTSHIRRGSRDGSNKILKQ